MFCFNFFSACSNWIWSAFPQHITIIQFSLPREYIKHKREVMAGGIEAKKKVFFFFFLCEKQNKTLDGAWHFLFELTSFCSQLSSASPPHLSPSTPSPCLKGIYVISSILTVLQSICFLPERLSSPGNTCRIVVLWLSVVRVVVLSARSLPWSEPTFWLSLGAARLWPQKNPIVAQDPVATQSLDASVHISLLLTLMPNGLNVFITWKCPDEKGLGCRIEWFTSASNQFFPLIFPLFQSILHMLILFLLEGKSSFKIRQGIGIPQHIWYNAFFFSSQFAPRKAFLWKTGKWSWNLLCRVIRGKDSVMCVLHIHRYISYI